MSSNVYNQVVIFYKFSLITGFYNFSLIIGFLLLLIYNITI